MIKGEFKTLSLAETLELGRRIGNELRGGEVIELRGDLGAGKTSLVRGIAEGIGSDTEVASPTFTISRIYEGRGGLSLAHFDFYRLAGGAGILAEELDEFIGNPDYVVCVEWAEAVEDLLPADRIVIKLKPLDEEERQIEIG